MSFGLNLGALSLVLFGLAVLSAVRVTRQRDPAG